MRTEQISGAGQVFSLLALSQSFWLLCSRPPLANGLLTAAAGAAAYGVVFFLAVLCRRAAAKKKSLSKGSAAAGMLLAAGALRLGKQARLPQKAGFWAGVGLTLAGTITLHYTGWEPQRAYAALGVMGLLWGLPVVAAGRGGGQKREPARQR